jgi:hypothetical protein
LDVDREDGMRKLSLVFLLVAVAFGSVSRRAEAQVFTPTFMAPRQSSDIGLYLSDGPGEFSIEGIMRRGFGAYDLGFRLGLADTEDLTVLVGGELRHPVAQTAPIDLSVTGHAQGAFGDRSGLGVLLGLALGYTFTTPEIAFTPYLHPRVGGVESLYGDDFDLELLADLGFDLRFSQSFDVRLGITFEDEHGAEFGVGLAWR